MKAFLSSLALIGMGVSFVLQEEATPKRSPGVKSVTYEIEVDLARARTVGWSPAESSDAEALEGAGRVVKRRLDAMGRETALKSDLAHKTLELRLPELQSRERELFSDMLESLGLFEFLFVADETNLAGLDVDLEMERVQYMLWREQNPDAPLVDFHTRSEFPAPSPRLVWTDVDFAGETGLPLPLLLPERPEDHVGAASLERAFSSSDAFGYPAVGIEFTKARAPDFERVTDAHTKERMAIVVEGKVRACPTLNAKLVDRAIIEGRFKESDVQHLLGQLHKRHGPLKVLDIR